MKKSRIILAAGAAILAVGSFVVGHASSKFAVAKAYYITALGGCKQIDNSTAVGQFSTAGTNQAQIRTSGGVNNYKLLYSNSTCTNAAYFKP